VRTGGTRLLAIAAAALAAALLAAPAHAAEPTGRHLVLLEEGTGARAAAAAIARAGARRDGRGVPRLGVVTVTGPAAAIRALRRQPGVERVVPEYRRELRREPNDPAWTAFEPAAQGTEMQWWLRRSNFPEAWDAATGEATVAIIDSGIDASHPDLAGRVVASAAFGAQDALRDDDGHGTHVSGLACAASDNGIGVASAGFDCRLIVVRAPELRDEDILNGIVFAADRGADAISMSFGGGPPSAALERGIEYAVARGVVLVAAASNEAEQDQGAPASQLQPGDAANLDAGRGLVVTAADRADRRAGTGYGPQISLAAYGFFGAGADEPPGLLSTYPGQLTPRELGGLGALGCGCRARVNGDSRYAYLQGTSMAAPQVAAVAALVSRVNPDLSLRDKLRIIKQSARRAGAGWEPELGWGILDAGAAVAAARAADRTAPASVLRSGRRRRLDRGGAVRVRVRAADRPGRAGLRAAGIRSIDVYAKRHGARGRYRRIRRLTRAGTARLRLRPGVWRLYARATDRAGNREAVPRRPDAVVRVTR